MTVLMLAVSNLRHASPRNVFTAATTSLLLTWSERLTMKRSPDGVKLVGIETLTLGLIGGIIFEVRASLRNHLTWR
jgi:hypothetical protein